MKFLCYRSSPLMGGRVIRCSDVEITTTDQGYRVNDHAAGAIGLLFNHDGLQVDHEGNLMVDPCYWLE